jgi:hypothetical protein
VQTVAAAAAIPTITYATGSDSPNSVDNSAPVAAGGAAIVAVGVDIASSGGGGPNCDPKTNELVELITEIAAEVISGGLARLTPGQQGALDNLADNPGKKTWLQNIFWGERIHRKVAELLQERYPGQFTYRHGGKYNSGPDFVHSSGLEIELTTTKERKAHERKAKDDSRYGTCGYAEYQMPDL